MKSALAKSTWLLFSLSLWAIAGCNSTELVSERSFEDKAESLRVGQSNRSDVENLLGIANVIERHRLIYYFADVEFGVGARRYAPPSGPLPIVAGAFPSNTRGVITAAFNDAGNLRQLAVERYFDQPFVNDYVFAIKETAKEPVLDTVAKIAADNGFKAVDLNQDTGTVTLLDNESKAQIIVKLRGRTLALTSKNPHSRLSTEYRLYTRREANLTTAIAATDWAQ